MLSDFINNAILQSTLIQKVIIIQSDIIQNAVLLSVFV